MSTCHESASTGQSGDVILSESADHVVLDNGVVEVTISKPYGVVTKLGYNGTDNLLEILNKESNRGYWDLNWSQPGGGDNFDVPFGTSFHVLSNDGDKVEVSFTRSYDPSSSSNMVPLNIDKRFVLLRGCSGFYTYAIFERSSGWPDFNLNQVRTTFKLRKDKFTYMAISDTKKRIMPYPEDRGPNRSQALAYPEAVLLVDPINPALKGEVDDKYQYSSDNKDIKVHGWISQDLLIGFWIITAKDEFRNGGPLKQNLTSHVGPTCLSMYHSAHYAGDALCPKFRNGEAWNKVFGPVLIYVNSASTKVDPEFLWEDAKEQMLTEVRSWPYSWPASTDYPKAEERGSISGRLLVQDWFLSNEVSPGAGAYLGLAAPGEKSSWQTDSKGYQFWVQADESGSFTIEHVRAGTYDLYGWIAGVLGDYKKDGDPLVIYPGSSLNLGDLVYKPPRTGPTIWEIGTPDRSAADFYIPDPNPKYINKLFVDHPEKFRQYGLWERYSEIYPDNDLVFTVGVNDWRKDWFFVHVCRIENNGALIPTTWQVKFWLDNLNKDDIYTLRLAVAASNVAAIQVRFNNPPDFSSNKPLFDTMQFGRDNAIARHGIHGLYTLWSVDVPATVLQGGENILYLTQRKTANIFCGVMYDYIRFEGPAPTTALMK